LLGVPFISFSAFFSSPPPRQAWLSFLQGRLLTRFDPNGPLVNCSVIIEALLLWIVPLPPHPGGSFFATVIRFPLRFSPHRGWSSRFFGAFLVFPFLYPGVPTVPNAPWFRSSRPFSLPSSLLLLVLSPPTPYPPLYVKRPPLCPSLVTTSATPASLRFPSTPEFVEHVNPRRNCCYSLS